MERSKLGIFLILLVLGASAGEDKTNKPAAKPATQAPPPAAAAAQPVKAAAKVEKLGAVAAKVGVTDSETRTTDWKDLSKGQKLSTPLGPADSNDKLTVKISTGQKLHQVFILLRNKITDEEFGFIAQADTEAGSGYKVDVDFSSAEYDSGTYEVTLYLGDFLIEDSVEWVLGDIVFKSTSEQPKQKPSLNPLYAVSYEEKPEIKHMFRQPEPRPPKLVSDAFTFLVLAPILVLFLLWVKIGVNIKKFPFTLSALGFHLGLTGIFGVYALFWIKLTMFEALKWMTIPCLITFITGNRLLKHVAERDGK